VSAKVTPLRIVHRGIGTEQMTPALKALLTSAANRTPFSLSLALYLLVWKVCGERPSDNELEAYFTPQQQQLLRHQRHRRAQWSAAFDKRYEGCGIGIRDKNTGVVISNGRVVNGGKRGA